MHTAALTSSVRVWNIKNEASRRSVMLCTNDVTVNIERMITHPFTASILTDGFIHKIAPCRD